MPTTTTIPFGYKELYGSANERFSANTWEAERIFQGPWDDRFKFINTFLPHTFIDPITGVTGYQPAASYPDIPLITAYDVDVKGTRKADLNLVTDQIKYDEAIITIKYRLPAFAAGHSPELVQINVDSYEFTNLSEEFSTEIETVLIPTQETKDNAGNVPENVADPEVFQKLYVINNHHYITEHNVFHIDWPTLMAKSGLINSSAVILPCRKNCAVGTLLYAGPSGNKQFTNQLNILPGIESRQYRDIYNWELTHHFIHKMLIGVVSNSLLTNSWNRRFNTKVGDWEEYNLLNGQPPYNSTDLNTVLGRI